MEGLGEIAEVRRDAPERLGEDERAALAELVLELDRHAGAWRRDRDDAAAARLQLWAGQTPDGKQRAAAIGAEPFPFEGSSDHGFYGRTRWCGSGCSFCAWRRAGRG